MTNTLTLLRRRNIAYLCIAVALLTLTAVLFLGFEPFAGGVQFNESEDGNDSQIIHSYTVTGNVSLSDLPTGAEYPTECESYEQNSSAVNITWKVCDATSDFCDR